MKKDKIKNSTDYLTSVIDLVDDAVFVKDDKHRFIFANDALCNMLGIKRKNIIGKTLGESLPKDQMEHFLKVDKMVLNSGQESSIEEKLTGSKGKILTIITKKTRYIDDKGNKFLLGVIHDITEADLATVKINEKVDELEKINSLMVGRELRMIELKREISNLKSYDSDAPETSASRYLDGIILEEDIILALKRDYETMVTDSGLSDTNKTKIIRMLNILKIDSESHEKRLRELDAKNQ